MRRSIFILVVALALPIATFAQVNATVAGAVSDPSAALIPGVEVTATNVNTGIAEVRLTNETGSYTFPSLQPGSYKVTAALPGFQTTSQTVTLSQGQQVRLNFTLQVSGSSQTVEVSVNADAALATTSNSVGDVLPDLEVRSLPLAVRDILGLIGATAGTNGRNFGGQGQRELNMTRDGLIINDTRYGTGAQVGTFVSADLVEEVKIVTSNVDAESGRGSGQVSLQTRSGTNDYHGALFYFNGNSAYNANTWFQNLNGTKLGYENRNQYGGRMGGPILKNKAFFFVLIDNQRLLQKANTTVTVLTPQARQGIFRYMNGVLNGNTGSVTPSVDSAGNPLNPANMKTINLYSDVKDPYRTGPSTNAYWKYVMSQMPLPNDFTTGDGLNTAGFKWLRPIHGLGGGNTVGNDNNRDQLNIRFDYQVNGSNKLTFTGSREFDDGVTTNLISDWPDVGFNGTNQYFPHLWTFAYTSTLSPTVLNEFRAARKQTSYHRRAPFQLECCVNSYDPTGVNWNDRSAAAQKAYDLLPKSNGYPLYPIPSVIGQNLMKHGFDLTRGQKSPTRQFSDTLSWTTGNHSFKFGFETVKNWSDGWNTTSEQVPTATIGSGGLPVQNLTATNFPGLQAADGTRAVSILNELAASISDFHMGYVINSPTQNYWDDIKAGDPRRFRHLTQQDWDFFVKDVWNTTKNLTMNIGMRYDRYGVLYDQKGMLASAVGGQAALFGISGKDFSAMYHPGATGGSLTQSQLVGHGSPNPKTLFWPQDKDNWGPAVGFSYKVPWLDRATVVRGGYGVNYSGATVVLDYENCFGNSPGSADIEIPSVSTYMSLAMAVDTNIVGKNNGAGAPNFFPTTLPGVIATVPLTSRTQAMNAPADDKRTSYVQSYNLAIQYEVVNGLTLDLSYVGNKAAKLRSNFNLNQANIFENGILDAFNVTRSGGTAPLFDAMFKNMAIPSVGTVGVTLVNGKPLTGSEAVRRWSSTRANVSTGNVSAFASFLNSSNAITGEAGGLLRKNGYPENFVVVNPQFNTSVLWANSAGNRYDSMQLQLTQRLTKGLSGQVSYTWSKNMTDGIALDPRDKHKGKRGDHGDSVNAHATYELPFGAGKTFLAGAPGWVDKVVGGWQISSIFTRSGRSANLLTLGATRSSEGATGVANIVGDLPRDMGKVKVVDGVDGKVAYIEYFSGWTTRALTASTLSSLYGTDPNALAQFNSARELLDPSGNVVATNALPGTIGNLGFDTLHGPSSFGLDMSLAKATKIGEGKTFTIRADATDALNHPIWGNPNVSINSENFGRITSATGARKITLSGRIDF